MNTFDEQDETRSIGCRAYKSDEQRYEAGHEFALTLVKDNKPVAMETSRSSNPEWDIYADFPTSYYLQEDAELHLKVARDGELIATRKMGCYRIGDQNELGQVKAKSTQLTTFSTHTSWVKPAEYTGPIYGNLFCNKKEGSLGAFPKEIQISGALSEDIIGIKVNQIQISQRTYQHGSSYCFEEFEMDGAVGYVHAIAVTAGDPDSGCYAVKVDGTYRFASVLGNAADDAKIMSVDSFEAFIQANQDPACSEDSD